MAPAYLGSFVVVESFVAEAYLGIVDKLLGSVGNSLGFGNFHNFGFDVEGYNNLKLGGDYNSLEEVEPNSRSWIDYCSTNCCSNLT